MRIRWFIGAAAVLAGLATGASANVVRDDVADSAYLALGADARYASVGYVQGATSSFGFSASGTLIGGHYVLTAGHVTSGATSMSITLGGQTFQATSWYSDPAWNGNVLKGADLGIMYFKDDLSAATGVQAANLYRGSSEAGKIATTVGYGMTGTGLTGATKFDGQKRAGQNTIDAFLKTGSVNGVMLMDFDNPHNKRDSSMGSNKPLALESTIGPGDSGGGMFIDVGGATYLAGVNSFDWAVIDGNANSDYGDVEGETRVSAYLSWIDMVLAGGLLTENDSGVVSLADAAGNIHFFVTTPAPAALTIFAFGLAATGVARRRKR